MYFVCFSLPHTCVFFGFFLHTLLLVFFLSSCLWDCAWSHQPHSQKKTKKQKTHTSIGNGMFFFSNIQWKRDAKNTEHMCSAFFLYCLLFIRIIYNFSSYTENYWPKKRKKPPKHTENYIHTTNKFVQNARSSSKIEFMFAYISMQVVHIYVCVFVHQSKPIYPI